MDEEANALGKALWTDADFDLMGWHDATVHAIAFEESDDRASLMITPGRIEGQDFELRFFAGGFHQHFRAVPRQSASQRLSAEERGGISFAQPTAF